MQGISAISAVLVPPCSRISFIFSRVFDQIPYSTDQGIILEDQGIFFDVTGNSIRRRGKPLTGIALNEGYPQAVETTNESRRIKY